MRNLARLVGIWLMVCSSAEAEPLTVPPCDRGFERATVVAFAPRTLYADLNEDRLTDAIGYEYSEVTVLLNRGSGVFEPTQRFSLADTELEGDWGLFAIADINGDRHHDLVF